MIDIKKMIQIAEDTKRVRQQTKLKNQSGQFTSKNEQYCLMKLQKELEVYPELLVSGHDLDVLPGWELDITIKSPYGWNVAIEWDGAYHRKPIYGEANLRQRVFRDGKKDKELFEKKYVLIRVKDDGRFNTMFVDSKVSKIIEIINDLMDAGVVAYGKIQI